MAANVFLVFFYGYDSQQLRYLEKWYLVTAYGVPLIPAISFLIATHSGRKIYGSALLWCWIRKDVDWMRIAFFYVPVWGLVACTMGIYVTVGIRIFKKRALLRAFTRRSTPLPTSRFSDAVPDASTNPWAATNKILVTTQIKYDVQEQNVSPKDAASEGDQASMSSYSSTRNLSGSPKVERPSSSISPTPLTFKEVHEHRNTSDTREQHGSAGRGDYRATAFATDSARDFPPRQVRADSHVRTNKSAEGNAAAMAYLKVAFLFFLALFVVWVSSIISRSHVRHELIPHKGAINRQQTLSIRPQGQAELWSECRLRRRLAPPRHLERHHLHIHDPCRVQASLRTSRVQDHGQQAAVPSPPRHLSQGHHDQLARHPRIRRGDRTR